MLDKREQITITLFIVSGLVLGLGAKIGVDLPKEQTNTVWALFPGCLLFVTGLITFRSQKAQEALEAKLQKIADWFSVTNWQVLLIFASPIFFLLASSAAGPLQKMYSPAFAIISWILGIGLAFLGSYRWQEEQSKPSKSTVFFLIIVTVIAFLFRGLGTKSIPAFLTGDEAAAGISAVGFANGDWNNIFITTWYSFPSLFSFIQSKFIDMFGQTAEALRVLSAIVGSLTVAAVYLCGRAMFGHRAGVFAALFLSALHFHIHFSRLGLNNIWDGLWYTITVGALWYGWEHNNRLGYLVAGLALGFSQYFYVSSRGLLGIVILTMLFAFLFQSARFYKSIPHFVLMFIVSTAVIFPLLRFYVHEPAQFFAPMVRASFVMEGFNGPPRAIDGTLWKLATKQIWMGLQAYTYLPIQVWYTPETPILRPMFATFFYIGIMFLFLKSRDNRLVLLLLWLTMFALMGGLSESPLAAQRYVAAAPAGALLIGYGLHKITDTLQTLWGKFSRVVIVVSYIILGIAMINDLYFYFIEYQSFHQIDNIASNGTIAQHLANRLEDQSDGTQVAFFAIPDLGYYSIPSIQYLVPHVQGVDVPIPWTSFDRTKLSAKHIIFVFLPERENEIEMVMAEYPNGTLDSERSWNNQVLFWIYDYVAK